jgi:hypothetical protein
MVKFTEEKLMAYDPLVFWPRHASLFPILARLARRFLAPAPTSCNVEEMFSVVGRICSPLRSRLVPEMLEALSCLHGWKKGDFNYTDARTDKRAKTAERFATLSISLEIIPGVAVAEEIEFQEDPTEDMAADLFNVSEL